MTLSLDSAADAVLARYELGPVTRVPLGSAGGFSGARLWRVESVEGAWYLKAWPTEGPSRDRLTWIHVLMTAARAAGLQFVPRVAPARDRSTWQAEAGRLWDLCGGMPGRADFRDRPTRERMAAACAALARLHAAWGREQTRHAPCATVQRRIDRLEEWESAVRTGWRPEFPSAEVDPIGPAAGRAWELLPPCLGVIRSLLEPLRGAPFRLQPCLGDVWHDHVLFTGNTVSGLIDYGAARFDTPAVDLARLLGSLAPTDDALYGVGLRSYQAAAQLSAEETRLVHVLDYCGTVLAAASWLLWTYRDRRSFDDRAAVARRLESLVARLERMHCYTLPLLGDARR
jgi:Ser/Thr protein kinase RdoA (MazF antagonist)